MDRRALSAARRAPDAAPRPTLAAATIAAFGRRADVDRARARRGRAPCLLLALAGAELDPASDYQQRFACKLMLVAVLLALAAWNRLRLTPLLEADYGTLDRASCASSIKRRGVDRRG